MIINRGQIIINDDDITMMVMVVIFVAITQKFYGCNLQSSTKNEYFFFTFQKYDIMMTECVEYIFHMYRKSIHRNQSIDQSICLFTWFVFCSSSFG